MLKSLVCIVLLTAIPALAQSTPQSIALTDKSTVPTADVSTAFHKKCSSLSLMSDATKSDLVLVAITKKRDALWGRDFDLTLSDRDGVTVYGVSDQNLESAVKDLCQALKVTVAIQVVDAENLAQSVDVRDVPSGGSGVLGAVGTVGNAVTGRRTHTDAATMNVIVNGERALLDCYERSRGCVPVGPGKYYGEFAADKASIWVEHEVPLTHKHVRDHYVIAGSW